MKNEMTIIYLITTGSTIKKVYSEQTGSVQNVDNKIDRYLRMLRLPDSEVRVMPLMNKDSLEMTDADREVILKTVKELLPEDVPIVIPIVLTGAMTPLGFEGSDGLQNLTESLFAARVLDPNFYVVMHNQVFPVHRVGKEQSLARFVWDEKKLE